MRAGSRAGRHPLGLLAGLAPALASAGQSVAQPHAIPFRLENEQVHVPVTIDGVGPLWFIVDTGASGFGCIDAEVAGELGLVEVGRVLVGDGSGRGESELAQVVAPELAIVGVPFGDVTLVSGSFARPIGPIGPIDAEAGGGGPERRAGILGLELFLDACLVIDYPRGRIELGPGGVTTSSEHALRLDSFGAQGEDERRELLVGLEIGGLGVPAVVDTGSASFVSLPLETAGALDLVAPPRVVSRARSFGNEYELLGATLREDVLLAGHRLAGRDVVFNEHHGVGIVGYPALRAFRLTIDAGSRLLVFEAADAAGAEPARSPQEEGG